MALTWAQGSFALNTATGNQVVDTGTGVEGKALILFGTRQVAAGFDVGQSGFISLIESSSARKCIVWASDDNLASPNTAAGFANLALRIFSDGTPTVDAEADFVSFGAGGDAGKFTINITDAPASAYIVHYVFLGGTDLTGVAVREYAAKTVSVGTRADTGVGFQGSAVIFIGHTATAVGNSVSLKCNMGAAASPSARGSVFWGIRDGHTGSERHYSNTTKCLVFSNNFGSAVDALADFVSFDADGYTLDWTDFAGSAWLYAAMVLRGIQADVDTILAPAATGNQSLTTDAFMPSGALFFGTGQTTADATVGNECHSCISAMGGAAVEEAIWTSEDDVVNTDANSENSSTKCLQVATNPATIAAEADAVSLDATGYTVNWTTTRTNSRFFGVGLGDAAAAAAGPTENSLMLMGVGL